MLVVAEGALVLAKTEPARDEELAAADVLAAATAAAAVKPGPGSDSAVRVLVAFRGADAGCFTLWCLRVAACGGGWTG